jgi:hypothetical protein
MSFSIKSSHTFANVIGAENNTPSVEQSTKKTVGVQGPRIHQQSGNEDWY